MEKKFTFLLISSIFSVNTLLSQYCMLPGRTPYSPLQPGITNFQLNTINRTSGNSESASSVIVVTGQTTTLTAGQTYTVSISHSEDNQFFVGARNNLRIWIDYNSNFSFTDAGETVLVKNLEPPATTYTATLTIPIATPAGTLTLRATAKMSNDAGHTIPTSCDTPADPLGYHGEMEDYEIVIVAAQGQSPAANFLLSPTVCVTSTVTATNTSSGFPSPTYNWVSNPSTGVTFNPSNTSNNPQISFASSGSYTITCQATNSVSSSSANKVITVSDCNAVGLSKNELMSHITIGPNPVNDVLIIQMPLEIKSSIVHIINYLGQEIYKKEIVSNTEGKVLLDLTALDNGIYFVKVSSDGSPITKQIIVNK